MSAKYTPTTWVDEDDAPDLTALEWASRLVARSYAETCRLMIPLPGAGEKDRPILCPFSNPAKQNPTLEHRGLDMDTTAELFGRKHLTAQDHVNDRFITIGHMGEAMVVLVWKKKPPGYFPISLRRASSGEQDRYQAYLADKDAPDSPG